MRPPALPRQGLGDPRPAPAPGAAGVDLRRDRGATQDLGRSPTVSEIARKVGVTDEEVIEGLESANAYATLSLDATDSGEDSALSMLDAIGEDDEALEHVENRESIKPLLEQLDPREKHILTLRFPRHDPVADRGRDRRLADARVPAADQDAGAPARTLTEDPSLDGGKFASSISPPQTAAQAPPYDGVRLSPRRRGRRARRVEDPGEHDDRHQAEGDSDQVQPPPRKLHATITWISWATTIGARAQD